MCCGAEWVILDTVKDCLDDLSPHDGSDVWGVFETSCLENRDTYESQELDSSHSVHAEPQDSLLSLVLKNCRHTVKIWLRSDNKDAVVNDVFEVRADLLEGSILIVVLEEVGLLLSKLSKDIVDEMESMSKVLLVSIILGTHSNKFGEILLLNQKLEEGFILTEFLED